MCSRSLVTALVLEAVRESLVASSCACLFVLFIRSLGRTAPETHFWREKAMTPPT